MAGFSSPAQSVDQDLVEGHAPWARDGESDHLGDVLRSDREIANEILGRLLGLLVGDVVGQLGRDRARLDHRHPDLGLQLLTQRLGPAVDPPLGCGVSGVAGPGGPPGNGRDVDQVAAAVAKLIEEHLGGRDRAKQVHLDHLAVVTALLG